RVHDDAAAGIDMLRYLADHLALAAVVTGVSRQPEGDVEGLATGPVSQGLRDGCQPRFEIGGRHSAGCALRVKLGKYLTPLRAEDKRYHAGPRTPGRAKDQQTHRPFAAGCQEIEQCDATQFAR